MTTETPEFYDNYFFDYEDEYMYPGYNFERPVYLYVWEIFVVVTCLQNVIILSVFLRRKMRNPTNIILSAIAISDSLTGLVTLPSYIMVFQSYDPVQIYSEIGPVDNKDVIVNNDTRVIHSTTGVQHSDSSYSLERQDSNASTTPIFYQPTLPPVDGYILSKDLCRVFMISKYFLSKSFHTISIFLTLFLEIQRYISMAYPYRYEICFNRFRIVLVYCVSVFIVCPLLHSFHLGSEKAVNGLCQWELTESGCGGGCVYLWVAFILRHFIPSITMVVFTTLFIRQLKIGEKKFRRNDSNKSQVSKRVHENRRISFVVTAIVVVRLIPEIPYSIFLLYNSVDKTVNNGLGIDLETNRVYHMAYEIALVVSFITNFYIYLIFNKSFRRRLYKTYIVPVGRTLESSFRFYEFASSSPSRRSTTKRIGSLKPIADLEMKHVNTGVSTTLGQMELKVKIQTPVGDSLKGEKAYVDLNTDVPRT